MFCLPLYAKVIARSSIWVRESIWTRLIDTRYPWVMAHMYMNESWHAWIHREYYSLSCFVYIHMKESWHILQCEFVSQNVYEPQTGTYFAFIWKNHCVYECSWHITFKWEVWGVSGTKSQHVQWIVHIIIHVYIYTYTCIYVYMYIYVWIFIFVHICIFLCTCIYMCIHINIPIYTFMYISILTHKRALNKWKILILVYMYFFYVYI